MFEWNDKKKKRNREEHGLHFEDAELVFSDSDRITYRDERVDYGEERFITMGLLEARLVVIAHTPRDENTRIISMRKANDREKKAHQKRLEAIGRDEG